MMINTHTKDSSISPDQIRKIEQERIRIHGEFISDPFMGYESLDDASTDCDYTSQVEALAMLFNRDNVFISGPAGSGKTHLINRFAKHMDAEYRGRVNIALTASTGIAAQLIGGRTIHSWSGMGISSEPFNRKKISPTEWAAKDRIVNVDVLIIDEVSMLPAYLFDKLDKLMKYFRKNNKPFGGVQLVAMGDFLQLPPVDKGDPDIDSRIAFRAEAWRKVKFKYVYLDKVRRATDSRLKGVLNDMAVGKMSKASRSHISSRIQATKDPNKVYTTLFTTNKNVDRFNAEKLAEIPLQAKIFRPIKDGNAKYFDKIVKAYGINEALELKVGATVIITSNIDATVSNGSVGVIQNLTNMAAFVKFNNGEARSISYQEYNHEEEYETKDSKGNVSIEKITVATVMQLPIRLGFAISVHKSQGQTFDGVVTDLSNCFQPGLGYVALSRVRDLEDLVITKINDRAYSMNQENLKVSRGVKLKAKEAREIVLESGSSYRDVIESELARNVVWAEVIEDREESF